MDIEIVKSIIIALAIGFMIGLQRTMRNIYLNRSNIAGSRTFALISLLGYLSGYIDKELIAILLLIFGLLLVASYIIKAFNTNRKGFTTQISAIITFLLGFMVYQKLENYAIFIAILMIALLEIKPKLRAIEEHISINDINSAILLLIMTFVLLPILPDKMIGPLKIFNPYKTWLMAVIIAFLSFIGYISIKFFGQKHGVLITGAAGGFISSTAVSITLSKMFQKQYELIKNYASGIAIACTFMYLRVYIETLIVNIHLSYKLALPYLLATFSGLIYSYYLYKNSKNINIDLQNSQITTNPLQLSEAIKFGILFGIIYGAIYFVEKRYGDIGVYIVSFLSGLTDVDAITLSLSQMAADNKLSILTSMGGVVIASVTNSIVKLLIVYFIGGVKLGWELTKFFILTLGLMGIGFFITI